MSPAAETILERLDAARQRWWLFSFLATTVLALTVSLGLLFAFLAVDAVWRLSQGVLAGLAVVWLGVTAGLIALVVRRLLVRQRSLEATARRVEFEVPELGSDLINLVQFAESADGDAFRLAALEQAARRVGSVRFEQAAQRESRAARFRHCMQTPRDLAESCVLFAFLLGVGILAQMLLPNWSSAASRLMRPWEFVPSVGAVQILEVTPGDTEVLLGEGLVITARLDNPGAAPHRGRLFVASGKDGENELPMTADEDYGEYRLRIPSVSEPMTYRLEIGDSQTRRYRVGVRERPSVAEVEIRYEYPAYLGRGSEVRVQPTADLAAPQFAVAELAIRPARPIADGHLVHEGQRVAGRVENDGERLVARLPLVADGTFTIHLVNDAGHTDPQPRPNRIRVTVDRPPTVELLKPPRQSSVAPGSQMDLAVRATDDYGLGRVRLESSIRREGAVETASPSPIHAWNDLAGRATAVLNHRWTLPDDLAAGDEVLVRAVAWDQRNVSRFGLDLGPQEAAGTWHTIRIVDAAAQAEAAVRRIESVRARLMRILEKQLRAQVRAADLVRQDRIEEAATRAAEVRVQQVDIHRATVELVESLDAETEPAADAPPTMRRALGRLATEQMAAAVRHGDRLVGVRRLEEMAAPAAELLTVQGEIVEELRRLLGVARRVQRELVAEMQPRPAGMLPDDGVAALEDLAERLDEALETQRRVVEAAEDLAKRPVEDFSEETEQLLKDMAAAEDDWSRFMNELATDLSKLPDQDFANPSALEELIEIQTEIRMAEDALVEKTVDIAVPLEQLGTEMAEELQTNLEKWLPDTPDRERWSQEEMLSDAEKEAPMAELPGELEDLIGELMEEEEALFDEMEDVSSSLADSLDAGAGWDVLDGPISNMSAKGSTGNRLPNTSEIGGRSGEGRSGRSSGEFVSEEAVGKGGRMTPSRLTPDPFVAGQVEDHSRDPTGGATGGGKESGQGGEGLEGPQRRPPGPRELERLAGRQAALRNKAEGLDLAFEIMEYHRTDLARMIEVMAQVERDLRAGRYQNALRQREVLLEGLGNIKQYVEGEFTVRQDATANLPSDLQKDILGSVQEASPPGWEELNRRYFRRLSSGAGPQEDLDE